MARAEAYTPARALDGASERDILQQRAGERGEATDRVVGVARDEDVLTVRRGAR